MSATLSDGELVVKLQSGDLSVLGILYERYKTSVYRTALAITHDPSAAEDILQDCFLRVYERAHLIDSSRSLRPWLYRVTVNIAYNRARRRKFWHASLDGIIDRLMSPAHYSPEWQAEMSDMYGKVIRAISSLNINQRSVIILFYLNSLSVKEIAAILECPVGTVKSRLYHGRENIRREIDRRAPFEMVYHAA